MPESSGDCKGDRLNNRRYRSENVGFSKVDERMLRRMVRAFPLVSNWSAIVLIILVWIGLPTPGDYGRVKVRRAFAL